jgi:hypothetical protein
MISKSFKHTKTVTPEQRQAAIERRNRIRKLASTISAMTQEQREEMVRKSGAGAVVTVEGRPLSPFNQCLLLAQDEHATVVGGFQQWRAAGRVVMKGAKSLALWFPIKRKEDKDRQEGETSSKDMEQHFSLGTVFDVRQTEEIKKEVVA